MKIKSKEWLLKYLHFDEQEQEFFWKERSPQDFPIKTYPPERSAKVFNTRYAGKAVGWSESEGYLKTTIFGVRLKKHQAVYLYYNGEFPSLLDHVDGDQGNNFIDNLRLATATENARNAAKRQDNTSGCTGVSFDKRSNKWRAYLHVAGKQKSLGYFSTKEGAISAWASAKEPFEFHQNHGREY